MDKTKIKVARGSAKKMKATLREVARQAGVSHTAVSRAINGLPGLSDETRERVMSIVAKTGYKPDPHLGAFFHRVRQSSRTITLLRNTTSSNREQETSESLDARQESAILAEARKAGYHVIISSIENDLTPDGNLLCVAEGVVDAVIANIMPSDALRRIVPHVPVVSLEYEPLLDGVDCVLTDVTRGVFAQVEHLHALGHRRIASFVPTARSWPCRHFLMGFEAACQDFDILPPDAYRAPIHFGRNEHVQAIHEFLDRVMGSESPPTAIVTYDVYAPELMRQCADRGLRLPEDMSIVGFDDSPDLHRDCLVLLTTFRQNFDQEAFHALRLLAARTPDRSIPCHTVLVEGELIVRGSTAAPKRI